MVIFHSYVELPEGIHEGQHINDAHFATHRIIGATSILFPPRGEAADAPNFFEHFTAEKIQKKHADLLRLDLETSAKWRS